jgi:hypothetical protein
LGSSHAEIIVKTAVYVVNAEIPILLLQQLVFNLFQQSAVSAVVGEELDEFESIRLLNCLAEVGGVQPRHGSPFVPLFPYSSYDEQAEQQAQKQSFLHLFQKSIF